MKMLHSICQQMWKTQQWLQDWKRSVFIPIPNKGNAKEWSNYGTVSLISHASKVKLKILQARLQQCMNHELSDIQAPFIEEALFAPLYILASFVKYKVPIGAQVYFWAFYLVSLVYISVFVPVLYYLNDCSFQYNLKSGKLIPPTPLFFLKIALVIQGLLCFHMNCEFFALLL